MASRKGIRYPEVIDLVTDDPVGEEVLLVVVEERPWSGDRSELELLQQKLNNYLRFALDGAMQEQFPEFVHLRPRIRLYSRYPLDVEVAEFVKRAEPVLLAEGVAFETRLFDELTQPS